MTEASPVGLAWALTGVGVTGAAATGLLATFAAGEAAVAAPAGRVQTSKAPAVFGASLLDRLGVGVPEEERAPGEHPVDGVVVLGARHEDGLVDFMTHMTLLYLNEPFVYRFRALGCE